VCGRGSEHGCDCPECPQCGTRGDLECFANHGLATCIDSVYAYCERVGVEPLDDCLRCTDRYDVPWVKLILHDGQSFCSSSIEDRERSKRLNPYTRVARVALGGISGDDSDWEWSEEANVAGVGFATALDDLRTSFDDALEEHVALQQMEDPDDYDARS